MKLKKLITENYIENIITSIFLAVHKNKINNTFKTISNDPKYKEAISKYEKSVENLKKFIENNT